ncbi:MAG: LysE family translocator [Ignavibacteriaceae bacterium]|jgi:threonine/homoserine/homoserine lactone efflux protein
MDSASIMSLAIALFVLAVTPGPGVLATVGRSLSSGFKPAAFFVLGILFGDLFFLSLAILGLGFVAAAMGKFFIIIKILSGGYLVFLGAKLLINPPGNIKIEVQQNEGLTFKNTLSGFGLTLSNPKTILFYVSFLPTFMNVTSFKLNDFFIASTEIFVVIGGVLLSYAYLTGYVRKLISNQQFIRRMNRTSGALLVGVGIAVVVK